MAEKTPDAPGPFPPFPPDPMSVKVVEFLQPVFPAVETSRNRIGALSVCNCVAPAEFSQFVYWQNSRKGYLMARFPLLSIRFLRDFHDLFFRFRISPEWHWGPSTPKFAV
jgi:hypothetical protein